MTSPLYRLRKDLRFVPQTRCKRWRCVVEDPISKKFFRIGRNEYLIASLFNGERDVDVLVAELNKIPEAKSISPALVQSTIRWLIGNGLVRPVEEAESNPLQSSPSEPLTAYGPVGDPFSFRIPLVTGKNLESTLQRLGWLYSWPVAILSLLIIASAGFVFAMNPLEFTRLSATLFVPDSFFWWMGAWLILKTVHELGHSIACIAHGCSLRNAGLAFFYLAPVPYVDTTEMWRLPNRFSRTICAASGVLAEVVAASIALLICNWTDNTTLQYLCITIATLGTITTIAFNGNPLTRFDGYFVLSDLLDRPSLWNECQSAFKQVVTLLTFGTTSPIGSRTLCKAAYGAACFGYRWMIMIGMAWGTWSNWRGLGIVMILAAAYLWFVKPIHKRWKSGGLASQVAPLLAEWPIRRLTIVSSMAAAFGILVVVIPSPLRPMAPGVVSFVEPTVIRAESEGLVKDVLSHDGSDVSKGEALIVIENPKLLLSLSTLKLDLEISEERCRAYRANHRVAEMQGEQAKIESLQKQIDELSKQVESLTPRASRSGQFVSRQLSNRRGQMIKSGDSIGSIVDPHRLEVQCSVAQCDVADYRSQIGEKVIVRSVRGSKYTGVLKEVLPRYSDSLDHVSLAAKYGGPIAVRIESSKNQKDPLRSVAPRNQARIELDDASFRQLHPGEHCTVELAENRWTILRVVDRMLRSAIASLLPESPSA